MPSRQALWPRAQAIQLLPTPVGPVTKSPSARSIQSPATSFWNSARSMPRGVRKSMSSTTAFCRKAANLRRVASRLVSRSAASRSTIRPSRSSNDNAAMSGDRRWSSKALAMPARPRAIRRSCVGWASMARFPFWSVEVVAATDVAVAHGFAIRALASSRKARSRPFFRIDRMEATERALIETPRRQAASTRALS